ncbi:MAG: hypothetical protein SW833_25220 [Cyanobacteriota bacterium]|nr:hypothetical protein [Cyanobacteriota bacterium]
MNEQENSRIWTDIVASRYFLISENKKLKKGGFIICSPDGSKKSVDATFLASFEIPESEAKALLQGQINQALGKVREAFSDFAAISTQLSQEIASTSNPSFDENQSVQEIVFSLLGVTPEALQESPETADAAFTKLSAELKALLGFSTSTKPAEAEAVRARLHSIKEALQARGIDTREAIAELLEKLPEVFLSSNLEGHLQEVVAELRDLGNPVSQSPKAVGKKIETAIHRLSDELLRDEEERLAEQRKQQYRTSAQEAIAESFRNLGIPSFAGGNLRSQTDNEGEEQQ